MDPSGHVPIPIRGSMLVYHDALSRYDMFSVPNVSFTKFYGYLSPLETLAYAGRLRGMSSKDLRNRSEAVLKEVKLTEWADHRIQEFSKGMKQRLAIAQSLLHEPDLLILDEPTSGLDPRRMAEVRDVIKSLKDQGRTIFMSSHLLGEVQEVCDDVALLK